MSKFCDNLKRIRKEKGFTQKELAALLNVTQGTIYFWENGRNYPNTLKIVNLLTVFQCSALDLLGDDINKIPEKSVAVLDKAAANTDLSLFLSDGIKNIDNKIELTRLEKKLLSIFGTLTTEGQQKVIDYSEDIASNPKYKNNK